MDKQAADFIRKYHVSGPLIAACIIGLILYKAVGLSAQLSAIIAIVMGVSDYAALSWLLNKADNDDRNDL